MSNILEFDTTPDFWTDELREEFEIIAKSRYPNEAICGVVDGKLVEFDNKSEEPSENFTADISLDIRDKLQGIVHTHPNSDIIPSYEDGLTQIALGIPSGIVSLTEDSISKVCWAGDHLLDKPLIGRPFTHGYYDCYSLIRSWYKQEKGIVINDYAREADWWEHGKSLYEDCFEGAGFKEVHDLEVGDVIMMNVNSRVPNHAGVYTGDNRFLHHLYHRLSKEDVLSSWAKMVVKIVRYSND